MGAFAIEIGVIIQARMGSSRLPGKVLKDIGDQPLLGHVLRRAAVLRTPVDVVVATSKLDQDDPIEAYCRRHGVSCFRASETNVLERYYQCALCYGFDHIVRLTADNPFYDAEELDGLIQAHIAKRANFSHSFSVLPVGVGAEIFTFAALEKSYRFGHEAHHIEHVDEYMLEHPEQFDTFLYQSSPSKCYPEVRLTIDTPEDYTKACAIFAYCDGDVTTEKAIQFCLRSA